MKYLIKENIVLSTENWEERNTVIKKEFDKDGKEVEIKIIKTIEEFAKENDFKIVNKKPEKLSLKETELKYTNELSEIRLWLKNNDWIPNKIITGEWKNNDKRWTTYLNERKAKRKRQDELEVLLGV